MRKRLFFVALGVTLVAGAATVALPAQGRDKRCEGMNPDDYFNKKMRKIGCSTACLEDITAMTDRHVFFSKGNSSGTIAIAKHGEGYYLALSTGVGASTREYKVRAADDPLELILDDGTEVRLSPVCDHTSVRRGAAMYYCGFYTVTREQLETLASRDVAEIKQFVLNDQDMRYRRLEQAEDGRSYFYWDLRLQKNQRELADHSKCALKL